MSMKCGNTPLAVGSPVPGAGGAQLPGLGPTSQHQAHKTGLQFSSARPPAPSETILDWRPPRKVFGY